MQVRDLMSREVVTVPADASLAEAVELMLSERVGSVIVTRDGDPAGIVTESDGLRAALRAEAPLDAIPVARVATSPLTTIAPAGTVRAAVERMLDADVKKLPVVEEFELVGVLTLSDVAWHYSDIRQEAADLVEGRRGWESED
jgi:CBS domain-containing protein